MDPRDVIEQYQDAEDQPRAHALLRRYADVARSTVPKIKGGSGRPWDRHRGDPGRAVFDLIQSGEFNGVYIPARDTFTAMHEGYKVLAADLWDIRRPEVQMLGLPAVSPGEVARLYLKDVRTQHRSGAGMGEKRVPWRLRDLPLLDVPAPRWWAGEAVGWREHCEFLRARRTAAGSGSRQGKDPAAEVMGHLGNYCEHGPTVPDGQRGAHPGVPLAYVDITSAHHQVALPGALDMRVLPGLQGISAGEMPLHDWELLRYHKAVRNAAIGSLAAREITRLTADGGRTRVANHNRLLAPGLYGYIQLTMHAIACDVMRRWGAQVHYIHTDGYIVDASIAGELCDYLAESWALLARIDSEGYGYIAGPARYTIATPEGVKGIPTKPTSNRKPQCTLLKLTALQLETVRQARMTLLEQYMARRSAGPLRVVTDPATSPALARRTVDTPTAPAVPSTGKPAIQAA